MQKFFKLELISIEKVNPQLIEEIIKKHHIHKGESSIKVRNVVKSEKFQVIGTLGIILKAHSIGKIKRQNCLKYLKYIQSHPKELIKLKIFLDNFLIRLEIYRILDIITLNNAEIHQI